MLIDWTIEAKQNQPALMDCSINPESIQSRDWKMPPKPPKRHISRIVGAEINAALEPFDIYHTGRSHFYMKKLFGLV
jgi:hypothetical protein